MQTQHLTDEEILKLGFQALMERLGPVGYLRFNRLQLERPRDNYAEIRDKIFEGMSVEEIYAEAARLEAERKKKGGAEGR
jgi:hypothetical protein